MLEQHREVPAAGETVATSLSLLFLVRSLEIGCAFWRGARGLMVRALQRLEARSVERSRSQINFKTSQQIRRVVEDRQLSEQLCL
jgi:hypothetical protein